MCQCFCGTCCKWHVQCASRVAATCQTCRRSSRGSSDKALSAAFFAQREGRVEGQTRQRCLVHKSQEAGRRTQDEGCKQAGCRQTGRQDTAHRPQAEAGSRRNCSWTEARLLSAACHVWQRPLRFIRVANVCVQSVADDTATTLSDPPA